MLSTVVRLQLDKANPFGTISRYGFEKQTRMMNYALWRDSHNADTSS